MTTKAENPGASVSPETIFFEGYTGLGQVLVSNQRLVVENTAIPINQITKVAAEVDSPALGNPIITSLLMMAGGLGGFWVAQALLKNGAFDLLARILGLPSLIFLVWGAARAVGILYAFYDRPFAIEPTRFLHLVVHTPRGREVLGRGVMFKYSQPKAEEAKHQAARAQVESVVEAISKAMGAASTQE